MENDFYKEILDLDSRLTIVPNPNCVGLSNVKFNNIDICPLPTENIKDEPDPFYIYVFPNGRSAPHKSKREVKDLVIYTLDKIKTDENYRELFQ